MGIKLHRWVLREYGHANQPHLVRNIQQQKKKKILDVLESAIRELRRMEAVLDRVPEQQVSALLAKLQAPPLNEIADMPTLVQVVLGLESIVNGSHPAQPDQGGLSKNTADPRAFVYLPCPSLRGFKMNTKTVTAQNCSLFEIDAELEEAFDQLQEEREITGTISNESRERSVQLFAELGKKIDRIAAYLRTRQRKASIAAEEAQRLQQRRRSAEQRVDDVKQMLTYFMRCRGLKRLEGELIDLRINNAMI